MTRTFYTQIQDCTLVFNDTGANVGGARPYPEVYIKFGNELLRSVPD